MESDKKKKLSLNVVSQKEHKGFGAGTLDLGSVSSVIIDGDEAFIDIGAMHAKSKVEKGIRFTADASEVPDGRRCWIVWVAVGRDEDGPHYAGAAACEMRIDAEARKGWKILADHVNKMDYAMKRRFILDGLDEREKTALRNLLISHNPDWWERSEELQRSL